MDLFLGHLRERISALGGELEERRVDQPIETLEADLLVNCAGIGNATHYPGLEQVGGEAGDRSPPRPGPNDFSTRPR